MNSDHYKPAAYPDVIPYLVVDDAPALMQFIIEALQGREIMRDKRDDGSIWHAQMRIGDAVIMLSDANADNPAMPGLIYVFVPDCDATHARAIAAGAENMMEPTDMDYGDRNAGVRHASGITWWIATRKQAPGYAGGR